MSSSEISELNNKIGDLSSEVLDLKRNLLFFIAKDRYYISYNDLSLLSSLIDEKNVNMVFSFKEGFNENTFLHNACENCDYRSVCLLLKKGADPKLKIRIDEEYRDALWVLISCYYGKYEHVFIKEEYDKIISLFLSPDIPNHFSQDEVDDITNEIQTKNSLEKNSSEKNCVIS